MKKLYTLMLALMVSAFSFGQINYLNDGFNYPDGDLLSNNGWAISSGNSNFIDVGTLNGLSYAGYNDGVSSITGLTPGNAAQIDNTGEDVNKMFTPTPATGTTIYYSFLLKVTNATAGHFIHLSNGPTAGTQVGRVIVRPSISAPGTSYHLGVTNGSTLTYAATPTELTLGATYLVIVKYDNSTAGAVSLWIRSSGIPATEALAGAPEVSATGSGNATIDRICLRQFSASQNETVDALYVSSSWFGTTPCSLSLGTETAVCDAVTTAIDTYTATIPFTGGNSGTYNLATTGGTIGGDNPTTTASGNITITNIPEGTSVSLTITGTCGLNKAIIAPECKPVNTLPYSEPFNYTAGTVLGTTQRWTIDNGGDNILVASGSLSYPGITATDNSITFSGDGAEARTPFTPTNSGTVYASFIANITDISNITADFEPTYFGLFMDNGNGSTLARIWHRRNGTQSQFGVSNSAVTSNIVWSPNLHNTGTTQYLVLGYDFGSQIITLTENPTIGGSASPSVYVTLSTAISSIGGFMFRQDSSISTPTINIDELRIDTTPNFTLANSTFNAISGLQVYPNPANDMLYITSTANALKSVSIYDVVGKQVLNTTTTTEAINVSDLNAGIYLVKITEEGKTATRKLVIR